MELDKDIEIIAQDIKDNKYNNATILVTGSTGLIGGLIVKGFLKANKKFGLNNKILALARNEEKFNLLFRDFLGYKDLVFIKNEITETIKYSENVDYIFHTACTTRSKDMVDFPVELITSSVCGTINILNFAKSHKAKSVVYLSSMEVYGVANFHGKKLKEDELGCLDLTYVRNCYPESKRLNEILCKSYFEEYGLNINIARLTQTFGAGVNLDDNRIFALIAKKSIEGKNVVLKTSGRSSHDYCYTTDAISALLIMAKKGYGGECYNIANNETFSSIYDMALMVIKKYNKKGKIIIENESTNIFSKDSKISLDTRKIEKLGWKPKFNLMEMYDKLIKYYKETM